MKFAKTLTLNNRVEIPQIQLGTWLINNDDVRKVVRQAIGVGYRSFDTAKDYGNEKGVGKGIWNSDIERSNIFLTTKLPTAVKDYEGTKEAIDDALDRFSLEYIDLLLIHSPQPWIEVNRTDDRYFEGNLENWRAMEEAVKAGKVRAIGVSNFLQEDVANIVDNGTIKPAVNHIEVHIDKVPMDLMNYCKSLGIQIEAYSPLAHGRLLKDPKINEYANKYNVSPAQLMLAFDLQLGCIVLPKSDNIAEMKENLHIDFRINDEDMEKLIKLKEHDQNVAV
ncbi:Aldehyde reductase [Lactobacillus helveticus CIRM-BIA 101]|uniref:aldo/keto reductase family protein n=1 Tax=Lactobacillus helveticus TaxID=1587 RepID=UPI0001B85BFC|nr:aldo/keto reductase [Lactobacillus helveticus]EEW68659.1 oxidoreductase, aldo/keto reductase family protein [Lactobacillus helveticus DSM 20075 = CGMCC 1.1877]KGL04043.1 2,5-diketo-D-gluconic acid reductase [Lactobacillus helveticus]KGL05724.1 2,5-diketo-D-gluconic acid reductase [Lactobacillus helveticus]KRL33102.1 aldo keto reductase family oxidoreductase [Lactobacillus helveticus DSM 20075 = CGMCC 1.1877]MCT3394268.1 aldo/keto reductase [Lactobacillus helveticus]